MDMSMSIWIQRRFKVNQGVLHIKKFKIMYCVDLGFKVHSGSIGQIKTKAGLGKRENYNIGSGDGQKVSCPQEKEDAIMDAFRHFNMI